MSKMNTSYQEQEFDDSDYGYPIADYPERDLELINMQIKLWGNVREQKQEVVDLAEVQLDEVDAKLSKLRAKQMMLKAQIDAQNMGHPEDK